MGDMTGVVPHGVGTVPGFVLMGTAKPDLRVACCCEDMNREINVIAHSRGCCTARELKREQVRIAQTARQSIVLNMLYPYSTMGSHAPARAAESAAAR